MERRGLLCHCPQVGWLSKLVGPSRDVAVSDPSIRGDAEGCLWRGFARVATGLAVSWARSRAAAHNTPAQTSAAVASMSALGRVSPRQRTLKRTAAQGCSGRVQDERGSLGPSASLRFPSPLIEPDVRCYRIRLSDWFHREAHDGAFNGRRSRRRSPRSP
jgi:hypothetical protein